MKKILFLLLFTVSIYGQTLQNPTFGTVTEKNNATDSTPSYFVTQEVDGVHKKTPAALIALKSDLPTSYAVIVYVNAANPNSATIFDDVNPPTTNDNAFKTDADNLYIGADASTWVYNGSAYITKSVPASSNFFIRGTTVDAGNSKTENIERIGSIKTSQTLDAGNVNTGGVLANSIVSNGEIVSKKAGSDTVNSGSAFRLSNNSETENNQFQLNASNGVDLWNYSSGSWNKRFTFSSNGMLGIGTPTPVTKLDIVSDGVRNLHLQNTNVGGFTEIVFDNDTAGFGTEGNLVFGLAGTITAIPNTAYFFNRRSAPILFGTDNTNRMILQANGDLDVMANISATNYNGSATLTGTPTAPTAAAGTNTTQIATTAFVQGVDANVVHKTGEETIGLGEKYFTDNVNFADIAVSGQATGRAAVFPNEFVIKSQLDLKQNIITNPITGTGTNGYIPFWNSTSTQTADSNLFWDNTNKRLGIGTVNPSFSLDIYNASSSSVAVRNASTEGLLFASSSGYTGFGTQNNTDMVIRTNALERARIKNNGRFLINSMSDDAVNQLQVNGTISASPATLSNQVAVKSQLDLKADLSSPALTGTPTAPTPTAGDNDTSIATTAFVTGAIATADAGNVKLTGTQFIDGKKRFREGVEILADGVNATDLIVFSGNSPLLNSSEPAIYRFNNQLALVCNQNGGTQKSILLDASTLTTNNRIVTFQDKDGTLALVGDILKLKAYTVSTLPAGTVGDMAYVTDATAPTYNGTLTGGGDVKIPVFYDGTAWKAH